METEAITALIRERLDECRLERVGDWHATWYTEEP